MARLFFGEGVLSGHNYRAEYNADAQNFDFMIFEVGTPYDVTIVKDNVGQDPVVNPTASGNRVLYKDGEIEAHESAGYSAFSPIVAGDIYITDNFRNYIDSQYHSGVATGIVKALKDSVTVHKWTQAGIVNYNLSGTNITNSEIKLKSLVESSNLLYAKANNPSIIYEPSDPSLQWTLWDTYYPNGSALMSRAMQLALLKVNDDIANNLIDVPDEIRDILNDTLPIRTIIDMDRADWTVNIDGERNPVISITVKGKNSELYNNANIWYQAQLKYNWEKEPPSTDWSKANYLQQPLSFTFNEEYSRLKGVGIMDKIRGLVANIGEGEYLRFMFSLAYTDISTQSTRNTAVCYADISYKGNVEGYGVYPYGHNEPDGSTVRITRKSTDDVISPFPDGDIDVPEDPLNPDDPSAPIQSASGLSLLTKSYCLTANQLKSLGNYLWSTSFTQNILDLNQSPIENILSAKVYPFTVPSSSDENYIKIGNVTTDTKAKPIASNTNIIINVGDFTIPYYYKTKYAWGEWIDYKTSISLFLPYIGLMPIDTPSYLGKVLSVKYYVDLITGVCKACLYVREVGTSASKNVLVDEFAGTIGIDIPITSNNRAQQELTRITSFASAGVSLLRGDTGGMLQGLAGGIIRPKDQIGHAGSSSPACDMMTTHDVFIVISRPKVTYPANYSHTYGHPCYNAYTLKNLQGFRQSWTVLTTEPSQMLRFPL